MATRMEYPNASCFDRIKPDTASYFENSCPNMCKNTLDHCEPFKTNTSTGGHCFCPGKDHHWLRIIYISYALGQQAAEKLIIN